MDITRPVHSIYMVCDNDPDVAFTKTEGLVIPAGLLDEVRDTVRQKVGAKHKRKGGTYVAKMRVKDPRATRPRPAKAVLFVVWGVNQLLTGRLPNVPARPE